MIETNVQERATGKTTEVIGRIKENENSIGLVPYDPMKKLYPKELQNRIYTINQLLDGHLRYKRFNKVIIDEGYLLSKDKLAQLYYHLGKMNIDVVVYGTIE